MRDARADIIVCLLNENSPRTKGGVHENRLGLLCVRASALRPASSPTISCDSTLIIMSYYVTILIIPFYVPILTISYTVTLLMLSCAPNTLSTHIGGAGGARALCEGGGGHQRGAGGARVPGARAGRGEEALAGAQRDRRGARSPAGHRRRRPAPGAGLGPRRKPD
eukprot:762196-Prorocentrum_minimum.AAC.1